MKKKKIISIVLSLALVISIVATAIIATANAKETDVVIDVAETELSIGQTTTVSVKVTTNYPVATMSIPVFYDKTKIEVSEATATLTDYAVKSAITDAQSVDAAKVYANTGIELNMIRDFVFEMARKYSTPILITNDKTSAFVSEVIRWLNVELAPRITRHGGLVEVYGEGILLLGESGVGKSETAIELVKRGHRLIADDAVEIRRVSSKSLVGTAPDNIRHFIELRGIGIIDVKMLFGVSSVKETQSIDLVIHLEDWDKDKEYDRLGLQEEYTEYLGNKVICHNIPIRPGRNLAVICESAAVNHRQKKMGYNAAQELYNRVQRNLMKNEDDD